MSAQSAETIIVGGGLAGLAAARTLKERGQQPLVLETSAGVGGWARTMETDGFRWEMGPHTFRGSAPTVNDFIEKLGLQAEIHAPQGPDTRLIHRNNTSKALPTGVLGLLFSSLLSLPGRLRIGLEPWIPPKSDPHESVLDFFSRRIGKEAASTLAGTFIRGIHAADAGELAMADAFPEIWAMEQHHGSLFRGMRARKKAGSGSGIHSPATGMGRIAEAMAQGVDVRCGCTVESIAKTETGWQLQTSIGLFQAKKLVLATPAYISATLMAEVDSSIGRILGDVQHSAVVVVHEGGHTGGSNAPSGFGVLTAPTEQKETLGILFVSSQFPGRAPGPDGWLLTSIMKGDEQSQDDGDALWLEKAASERKELTGFAASADWSQVVKIPRAIPKMRQGHLANMKRVEDSLADIGDIALAGSYMRGVSIDHAMASGVAAANQLNHFTVGPV